MFGLVVRAVTRRPWLVIAGWLIASAAIIGSAPKLADVTNADQAAFLPDTTESARAADLAHRAFPDSAGASAVLVVSRTDRAPLTDVDIASIGSLTAALNANRAAAVLGALFDPATSVAPNRSVATVAVAFAGPAEDPLVHRAVASVRSRAVLGLAGTGLTSGMTGEAAIAVDNRSAFAGAERIVTGVTVSLIVLLLLLIFRSPIAAALPLLTVGLVYAVSTSLVAFAGKVFRFEVGQEVPTMMTVVLFGIGTDYLLFLLFRYRERRRAGDPPREAIVGAVERVGEAICSAAFAVAAAFGALILAGLGFFTTLGPSLAIGVLVMLAAALTLAPAVVTVLGRWAFWPSRSVGRTPRRNGFAPLGRLVARRPAYVAAAGLLVLGGLAMGVLRFIPTYDPVAQLPARTEAARAYADLKRGFPAGALAPTQVYLYSDRPLAQAEVAAFVQRLGVAALAPRVSADGSTVAVPVILNVEPYSAAALDLVSGPLREAARAAAPPGATVLVGGQTMAFADVRDLTQRDLSLVFPVAAALFVLILGLLLRAVLAPFYLVAMVVLGFAATLGGASLGYGGGLAFSIPIVLYLFVTAIGTDYNILITARLREEIREGRPPRTAAALAVAHAGPSVAAAALILAGTFGSLLLSGVPFFVEIGVAVTLGILLVAFVVALLLVPSVTALLGRAAWWPGTRMPDDTLEMAGELSEFSRTPQR